MKTIIVFDTETTGLTLPIPTKIQHQPFMTEIFCYKMDENFKKISEFESMVKPPIPISKEITKITGITDQHVANAPMFFDMYDDLYNFFKNVDVVVGHNVAFDIDVVHYELMRHDLDKKFCYPKNHICTVEKSYHYKNKRLKLADLYSHLFDAEFENAHRARNDVLATVNCFAEMVTRGDIKI